MKICWDMLKGVCLTRNGTFRKGEAIYIYKEACTKCGEPYLTQNRSGYISSFCGRSCAISGKSNHFFGKTHSVETKKKISKRSYINQTGSLNPSWKGEKAGFTVYNIRKNTLGLYEDVRKQKNIEVLEAKCAYCGQWFPPTSRAVDSRIAAINTLSHGESRLYCSESCKQACPTYYKKTYPKGFKKATSREVSTYLRQMVFERDNWECQKCGKTIKEIALHCHHIKGYAQNKILANDIDNCITLCKGCHREVHRQKGCSYTDLQCEKNK